MKKVNFKLSPYLTVFFMVVIYLLLVRPKVIQMMETKNNIKLEKIKLVLLTEKEDFLKKMDQAKNLSNYELLSQAVPSEKDIPSFLSTVDLIAKEASVSVLSVQTSPGKISTESAGKASITQQANESEYGSKTVNLSMMVNGSFSGIKFFIKKLANSLPLTSVKSISFSRKEKSTEVFGNVTCGFVINFHYLPLPKFLGKISEPIDKINSNEEKIISQIVSFTKPNLVEGMVPVGRADPFAAF